MKKLRTSALWICSMMIFSLLFTVEGNAQNTPQLTDPEIASVAVTANQIDVNYALIALKKSKNTAILEFAKTMKDDHNAVIKLATDLAKKLGVTPKTNDVTNSLLAGEQKTTKALKSKSGSSFNKAYVDNEVAYHEAVINAVETVLIPQAKNAELKGLLVKVLPTLKTHLEHAKMIQSELN